MKKLLFFILIFTNIYAYSQTIRFTNQVRQTRIGSIYRLQLDSSFSGNWRNFATEDYVQGWVANHGGIAYTNGNGIDITNGVISLSSIGGYIAQGANVSITGSGTAASPYTIAATGTGGVGANANVGSAYRWAVPLTQNIKTFANGVGILLDSLTANTLTAKADTNLLSTKAWRQKGIDSINGLLGNYALTSTLASSLAGYVPITTLVSSGYGLLGGGQLNANRTIFVDSTKLETKLAHQKAIDSIAARITLNTNSVSFPGSTVSANYAFAQGNGNTVSGIGSVALGTQNATVAGTRNVQIGGQNTIIATGTIGIVSATTDGHFYGLANYAFAANDANEVWGESAVGLGFGNDVYAEDGFAMGSGNVVGYNNNDGGGTANLYSASLAFGVSNRVMGNRAMAFGRVISINADDAVVFGTGVDATTTQIAVTEASSFNVGFNSTIPSFKVHAATGAGTAGITEVAGNLKINTTTSISNDDALTQVLVKAADGTVKYRTASSITGAGLSGSLTVALTDGATINTNATLGYLLGSTYRVTLGGNRTIANPTGATDGQRIIYEIHQDATGSRLITWGSAFMFSDDIPVPTLSTNANYVDIVGFEYNASAGKFYVTGVNIGLH